MIRTTAIAAALVAAIALGRPALSQISPTDTGAGTKLGMSQQNNSGETGTVTLFRRGPSKTLVVLNIQSEPPGRQQPAHIHRGKECSAIDPKPAYGLAPVINGVSKTIVDAPKDKLLSGNYVVNVHASSQNIGHYVSCGELYS
jgi:hypothetical protein